MASLNADLARQNRLHHVAVASGSKVRSKVTQLIALLAFTPQPASTQDLKPIVCISAPLPASSKLVSVVEIAKRHACASAAASDRGSRTAVLYQYNCVLEAPPLLDPVSDSLAASQHNRQHLHESTAAPIAAPEDQPYFETLAPPIRRAEKTALRRERLMMTVYLSKHSIKLLKDAFGEQAVL